jgi:hypothetical protein
MASVEGADTREEECSWTHSQTVNKHQIFKKIHTLDRYTNYRKRSTMEYKGKVGHKNHNLSETQKTKGRKNGDR